MILLWSLSVSHSLFVPLHPPLLLAILHCLFLSVSLSLSVMSSVTHIHREVYVDKTFTLKQNKKTSQIFIVWPGLMPETSRRDLLEKVTDLPGRHGHQTRRNLNEIRVKLLVLSLSRRNFLDHDSWLKGWCQLSVQNSQTQTVVLLNVAYHGFKRTFFSVVGYFAVDQPFVGYLTLQIIWRRSGKRF